MPWEWRGGEGFGVFAYWAGAVLAGLSGVIQAWQCAVALRFPLHRRPGAAGPSAWPGVSVLKPIRGADPDLRRCLETWMRQEYAGPLEILFAVDEAGDPACAVLEELLEAFPGVDARVVVVKEQPGPNAKVCKLAGLEGLARNAVLVTSDADVAVPPDLVRMVVVPLADPAVGLSNCLYRLANPSTPALRCEAVGVNADFWSQVLQSRSLAPQDFALGAVMALRREDLGAIGGFRSVVEYLADDFHLGRRIHERGLRIELIPVPVDCWDPPAGWREVWIHQLRWSRTIRVCRPWPFLASIVSNGTVWPLAWLGMAFAMGGAWWPAVGLLGFRAVIATGLAMRMGRGLAPGARVPAPWWVWVKDLQAAVLWAAAFLGNEVEWRGRRYRVARDGRMFSV